ncbi:MAG TPA: HypC/HybG/HupF family hydrogenase formation chaperone [Acidimicrobiia bacterium]|nr:HypC/HybG/HupF family hydrogenase formation chaperone [Acidimicrobiia bacterium]
MCVAIPGRVVRIGELSTTSIPGRVSIIGTERDVDLVMVPDAMVGDYVLVHSGYAIKVIPKERAVETLVLLGIDAAD